MASSTKSSTLVVKVISDASQAQRELADTAGRIEGFQKKLVGAAVGLFAFDKLQAGVRSAVSAASDLEQSVGGVDAVFKSSAAAVHAWAADTSDSIRIPQAEFEQLATIIGAQLKNAGVSMSELAPKTHDLMQLGADLAAQFGTDIPSAIEAVSSALKGERDPIERYGVTLKQASINAKALELAQGDTAKAASTAFQAQATLALIYQQTADAAGAAARESDTYQAKMDSLKEKTTNAAAVVGGPLLTAFGSLADRAGDLIPILTPLAQGVANVVQAVATLPTPVLAAVAALAGLVVVFPAITRLLAAIGPAIQTIKAAWAGMVAAMANPVFWAVAAALVAAGVALAIWADNASKAAEAAAKFKTNVQGYATILEQTTKGMMSGAESGLALRAEAYKHIEDAWKDLIKTGQTVGSVFKSVGSDVGTGLTGLMGDTKAAMQVVDAFNTKIVDLRKQIDTTPMVGANGEVVANANNDAINEQIRLTTEQRDAYERLIPEIAQARLEEDARNGALGEQAQAVQEAVDAERDLKQALEDAQKAANATAGNQMLEGVKRAADDAARSVGIFNAAMEDLTGRSSVYESTTLKWADGIRSVAEAGKDFVEANGRGAEALANWDIGALAATESGSKLAAQLISMGQNFGSFVTQAFEASGGAANLNTALGAAHTAADQAYSDFLSIADSMGLSAEQAQQLAGKLGIVNAQQIDDKVFEIIAQDEQARSTVAALQAQGVDPKTIKFVADTDPATEGLQAGLTYIDAQTQQPITITIGGDADPAKTEASGAAAAISDTQTAIGVTADVTPAQQAIQAVLGGTYAVRMTVTADTGGAQGGITALVTQQRTLTISVAANVGPAQQSIAGVVGGSYSTTVQVKGDNGQAIAAIRSVTTGSYQAMITVLGDNGPAIAAVRAITTGYYTATVHITGDASAFYSVWNSLPTSRTITVTVNQVQGSVVAPAPSVAPSGFSVSAAPEISPMARGFAATPMGGPQGASYGGIGTTNITIQAGIGDPDAIARAVKRVVLGRDRRTGGVVVGNMRTRVGYS